MQSMWCILALFAPLLLVSAAVKSYDTAVWRKTDEHYKKAHLGLSADSTWSSDHGDTARSKFTIGSGLPLDFHPDDIKVVYQKDGLPQAQWIYTAGPSSEFLYLIGGQTTKGCFVAKVNAFTMEIIDKFQLKPALYIGGLLIHKNGNVYCMHSNVLYTFWNGDLSNSTAYPLPTKLNSNIVQTNGMLVTQDGYIVVKQWSIIPEDILLFVAAKKQLIKLYVAFMAISAVTIFYRSRESNTDIVAKGFQVLVGGFVGGNILFTLFAMGVYLAMNGTYNPWTFITSNTLFYGGGGGELKIIDPVTFAIVGEAQITERCSYARMSMMALTTEVESSSSGSAASQVEDAIVLLGDEHVYQFRWVPSEKELYMIPSWTTQYRSRWEGTFPGTGPAIYEGVAYFTDNTFPVFLSGFNYQLFATPLEFLPPQSEEQQGAAPRRVSRAAGHYVRATEIADAHKEHPSRPLPSLLERVRFRPPAVPRLQGVHLTREDSAAPYGFMFWSVVINPLTDGILVWDSIGRSVQSRYSGNIHELQWEIRNITQGDCLSVAVHRPVFDEETGAEISAGGAHVYMTDYDMIPSEQDPNAWLQAVGASLPEVARASKYFIVADGATGAVRANVSIAPLEGIQASVIVPGAHNDVFIGTRQGLLRIYV